MSKSNSTDYLMVTRNSVTELADPSQEGGFSRYWKQIARYGEWVDPRNGTKKMKLDRSLADGFVKNFESKVGGFVPVPLGHPQTAAELAALNRGELLELSARDDGLYGLIEIRHKDTAESIDNKLIPDVSMGFTDNYQDKESGNFIGPLIKHIGLVADPYIKGMASWQTALSDTEGASILFSDGVVSDGNNKEEGELTMGKVINDRDFEVSVVYTEEGEEKTAVIAAGAELEVPEDQVEAVTKLIADAVKVEEEEEELSDEDKRAKDLADRELAVAAKEAALADKEAKAEFAVLLSDGKVVPAQEEAFLALKSARSSDVELADGETKTVDALLSEFLDKVPSHTYLSEAGVGGEGSEENEDVEITDEEESLAETFGNTKEQLAAVKKEEK